MKFFKSPLNLTFIAVILMLVAGLIFSVGIISEKNSDIKGLESEVSYGLEKIEEIESGLSELQKTASETQSKLEAAEKQNSSLKSENSSLAKANSSLNKENSTLKKNSKVTASKQSSAKSSTVSSVASKTSGGQKVCYLTFDDGPSENTLKILKILDKYDAKATFFVINTNKIGYVKQINEAGHTVGLHSYSHVYNKIYNSSDAYFADLKKISDKVKSIAGVESKIIRFPGGSSNSKCSFMSSLAKQVESKGYYYFDWNVDSSDASGNNVSYTKIRDSVLTSAVNKNSICVLMHDTDAKDTTVKALPEIIEGLKKQGYIFKGLDENSNGYHHNIK